VPNGRADLVEALLYGWAGTVGKPLFRSDLAQISNLKIDNP